MPVADPAGQVRRLRQQNRQYWARARPVDTARQCAYINRMKRFTITLPEDLHAKFKIACTLEGTDMSEIVRRCIQDYVARVEQRKMIPFGKEK